MKPRQMFSALATGLLLLSCFTVSHSMPPLTGGPMPPAPPGVDAVDRNAPARDDIALEGEWNCLVILVDFPDYTWDNQEDTLFNNEGNPYTQEHFEQMLFSEGEFAHPGSESDYTGSMRDYYTEISGEQFTVEGVVTEWYRAPRDYRYYCNADGEFGTDDDYGYRDYPANVQGLVETMVERANDDVDFSDFDNDDDGVVDALFIVHAGPGAESFGRNEIGANYFWSHKWAIDAMEVDGVLVSGYTIQPEDGSIGVFCHEFGHALGLPDLYDVDGSSEGIGEWCLMSSGGWCYRPGDPTGTSPSHMSGWAKKQFGWVEVIDVEEDAEDLEILPVATDHVIYKAWTRGDVESREYFLLENRRRIGFDAGLTRRQVRLGLAAPEGLLITHIDDSRQGQNNADNSIDEHRLVDVEDASPVIVDDEPFEQLNGTRLTGPDANLYNPNRGDNGDLWPGFVDLTEDSSDWMGERSRVRFGVGTVPSSVGYSREPSLVEVANIRLRDDLVVCDIRLSGPEGAVIVMSNREYDDEEGGNGNHRIEPGERIELAVELHNYGEMVATEIVGNLRTTNESVNIIESEAEYPDLEEDEAAFGQQSFVFVVSEDAPPTGLLEFELLRRWRSGEQAYSDIDRFRLEMRVPYDWFKYPANPVLYGEEGAWNEGIMSPATIVQGDTVRCWFFGFGLDEVADDMGSIGYAYSPDGGINWEMNRDPVLTRDEEHDWMRYGLGGLDVIETPNGYLMAFHAWGTAEGDTVGIDTLKSVGIAHSEDGFAWDVQADPAFMLEDSWAIDFLGGQLALEFNEAERTVVLGYEGAISLNPFPLIGIGRAIYDFDRWEVEQEPFLLPSGSDETFDTYACVMPDFHRFGNESIVLYTGVTANRFGEIDARLGIQVIQDDGDGLIRYRGERTGGSVLEAGGEGSWDGEELLFGGRIFEWNDQRRMLYGGVTVADGYAALGLAAAEQLEVSVRDDRIDHRLQPGSVILDPAYPNPFNNRAVIEFRLNRRGWAQVSLLDVQGRRIAVLENGLFSAGRNRIVWDGRNANRLLVSNGIYIVQLKTKFATQHRRVVLMK